MYLQGETPYDLAKRHKVSWMGNRWLTELEPPGRGRRNPCQRLVTNPVGANVPPACRRSETLGVTCPWSTNSGGNEMLT